MRNQADRPHSFRSGRSLRVRILLYAVLSVLLVGGVMGILTVRPLMAELEEAAERELSMTSRISSRTVGEFARSARALALQITSRTRIREALEAYGDGEEDRESLRAFTEPKLADALALSEHARGITRLDMDGRPIAAVGESIPGHLQLLPSELTLTDLPAGREGPRFLVAAPIQDPTGRRLGADLVVFDAEPIIDLLLTSRGPWEHRFHAVALFSGRTLRATGEAGFLTHPPDHESWVWEPRAETPDYRNGEWRTATASIDGTPWRIALAVHASGLYADVRENLSEALAFIGLAMLLGIGGVLLLIRPLTGTMVLRQQELREEVAEKTAEAEQQRRLAEQANEAKTAFLSNMSHDLRTPLQGILGFLSLLSERLEEGENRKYTRYAEESANDLLRQVDELLEISRIESGSFTLQQEPTALRETLEGIVALLRPRAEQKHLQLSWHVGSSVPEYLITDKGALRQVLINLVENAIKYTPAGWVHVRGDYEQISQRGILDISVQDSGTGIPEAERARIFDRFSRLDYTSSSATGTGLGLTISKGIVELLGGELSCHSVPEEGSVFRFRIPVTTDESQGADETSRSAEPPETRPSEATAPSGSLRVLVAEDDRMNQMFIGHLLDRLGYTHRMVGDGREMLDTLDTEEFDLILLDVQMPRLNGMEATRELRRMHDPRRRDLPVLAMTAFAGEEEQRQFLEAGVDQIVTKPLTRESISRAIKETLEESRQGVHAPG